MFVPTDVGNGVVIVFLISNDLALAATPQVLVIDFLELRKFLPKNKRRVPEKPVSYLAWRYAGFHNEMNVIAIDRECVNCPAKFY